jgi:hypothetical protein
MLDDIRLTAAQMRLLDHAASIVGGTLIPGYEEEFRPWASPPCLGLRCDSPGQLMRFGALVGVALDLPDPLLLTMAARTCEDRPGAPPARVYYWPGVQEQAPLTAVELAEARRLARHLVAVHKNAAALGNDPDENTGQHHHEHFGPGGLRDHPYEDHRADEADLAAVLAEAHGAG